MNFRLFVIIILLASSVTLPACVYRQDIPQGNRIDADVIQQLETGMTRRQVIFLLGKPAITDPYRADVWYYIYYLKSGNDGTVRKQVMTLRFTNDQLSSVEGKLNDG